MIDVLLLNAVLLGELLVDAVFEVALGGCQIENVCAIIR